MRCHLMEYIYNTGLFPPSSSKFRRPCGSPRFPSGFRQKISVRRNFLPEKRSEGAGTDVKQDSEGENCDRRSACATRDKILPDPLFMPYPGMKPLSTPGCGEGSPAPSALHVRDVLSVSTSAGIACPFLGRNGLSQRAAWHKLFRIWRNIPKNTPYICTSNQ